MRRAWTRPRRNRSFSTAFRARLIAWRVRFTLPAALAVVDSVAGRERLFWCAGGWSTPARKSCGGRSAPSALWCRAAVLCAGLLALLIAVGKVPRCRRILDFTAAADAYGGRGDLPCCAAAAASVWLARRAGFWGFWVAAASAAGLLAVATAAARAGRVLRSCWRLPSLRASAALPALLSCEESAHSAALDATDFAALLPDSRDVCRGTARCCDSCTWRSAVWPGPSQRLCCACGTATCCRCWPPRAATRAGQSSHQPRWSRWAGWWSRSACRPTRPNGRSGSTWNTGWMSTRASRTIWRDASRPGCPRPLPPPRTFDPAPRRASRAAELMAFFAAAPKLTLAAPELQLISRTRGGIVSAQPTTHFELRLRSARGAPEALVVFPASAQIADITLATASGPVRTQAEQAEERRDPAGYRRTAGGGRGVQHRCRGSNAGGGPGVRSELCAFPRDGACRRRGRRTRPARRMATSRWCIAPYRLILRPIAECRNSLSRSSSGWHEGRPAANCRFYVSPGQWPDPGIVRSCFKPARSRIEADGQTLAALHP